MTEWAPTPGTKPFSTIKREIARYVLRDESADALTAAGEAANNGVRFLNLQEWRWGLSYQDITFVVGQADYNLDTQFDKPRSFSLMNSSDQPYGRLEFVNPKTFEENWPYSTENGHPHYYTVFNDHENGLVTLNHAPSQSWVDQTPTGRLRFFRRLSLYAEDDNRLDGPTEAELFVIWYGRFDLANTYAPEKAAAAEKQFNRIFQELKRKNLRNHDYARFPRVIA